MNDQLFIPSKINIGFQGRTDTYTGKLGYITYWDNKGKLRKEPSWEGWRWKVGDNKSIWNQDTRTHDEFIVGDEYKPQVFDNSPTEGFVLNKDVGGTRRSYGWNARVEKVRVYDPRNFEFEISIPNLLFILQETSAIKGKGLEGKFVYAWSGPELILLPVSSEEYKNSAKYTDLQSKKVTKNDISTGRIYRTKKQDELMYLGKFDWNEFTGYSNPNRLFGHIFYDVNKNTFRCEKGFTNIGEQLTSESADNYSDIVEEFQNSKYYLNPVSLTHERIDFNIEAFKSYYNNYCYIFINNEYYYGYFRHDTTYDRTLNRHILIGYTFRCYKKINSCGLFQDFDVTLKYTEESVKDVEVIDLYVVLSNGKKINIVEYLK